MRRCWPSRPPASLHVIGRDLYDGYRGRLETEPAIGQEAVPMSSFDAPDRADGMARTVDTPAGGPMDVHFVSDAGIEQHPVGELEQLLARDHGFVWVDMPVCDEEAAQVLSEVFGFHPLAIQAYIERNTVPKVRAYPDHVFVVQHAPEFGEGGHVHYVELDQFIGARFVVTVHGPVNPAVTPEAALRETRAVLGRIEAGRLHPGSPSELSHAIVSALAEGQEAFVETVTRQVWPLEQRVTSGQLGDPEQFLEELFSARHALLAVSNMAASATSSTGGCRRWAASSPLIASRWWPTSRISSPGSPGWPTARSATWRE